MSNSGQMVSSGGSRRVSAGDSLADILDRVLDKGVVIAGDISIALVGVELLTIKIRLLIASADKAREMGIDWWRTDPFLTGTKIGDGEENQELLDRIARLEKQVAEGGQARPARQSVGTRARARARSGG